MAFEHEAMFAPSTFERIDEHLEGVKQARALLAETLDVAEFYDVRLEWTVI